MCFLNGKELFLKYQIVFFFSHTIYRKKVEIIQAMNFQVQTCLDYPVSYLCLQGGAFRQCTCVKRQVFCLKSFGYTQKAVLYGSTLQCVVIYNGPHDNQNLDTCKCSLI